MTSARKAAADKFIAQSRKRLAAGPLTVEQLRATQIDLDKALKADPNNSDARALAASVKSQSDMLLKRAESLYLESGKAAEARDWPTAINKLRELRQFYPQYLDLAIKLPQTESAAMAHYLKEVERLRTLDDLDGMTVAIQQALAIQPDNQQLVALLADTKSKIRRQPGLPRQSSGPHSRNGAKRLFCSVKPRLWDPMPNFPGKYLICAARGQRGCCNRQPCN